MTAKSKDKCNRWRCITVAFRVSPEENQAINDMVRISGMTKQDYLSARVHNKEIVVRPNPRVYKGLKTLMEDILEKLKNNTVMPDEELQETIRIVANALNEMKGGNDNDK